LREIAIRRIEVQEVEKRKIIAVEGLLSSLKRNRWKADHGPFGAEGKIVDQQA